MRHLLNRSDVKITLADMTKHNLKFEKMKPKTK
jgi:hypothetical protein